LPADDLDALSERQRVLVDAGVDSALAVRVASGDISAALLDIAEVAATCNRSLELVAGVYFSLGTLLNYGWIGERAANLPTPTHWDMLARAAALAEVARLKRTLATSALAESPDSTTPETIVGAWRARREAALVRYEHLLADLRASGGASLAVLLVVVREMAVLERA
ncbi:NAD-glutamate dehydrogenase, partial [Burkholderia cenocepacia]